MITGIDEPSSQPIVTADGKLLSKRRFRWRILPVGIIAGVGVIYVGFGVFALFLGLWIKATGEPLYTPGPLNAGAIFAVGISSLLAGTWLV